MRTAALILIGLQAAMVVVVIIGAVTVRSDPAGEGMAAAYAVIASVLLIVLALPALLVALLTRQQWLALTLAIVGSLVFALLIAIA
jgi:hypothetical protein